MLTQRSEAAAQARGVREEPGSAPAPARGPAPRRVGASRGWGTCSCGDTASEQPPW